MSAAARTEVSAHQSLRGGAGSDGPIGRLIRSRWLILQWAKRDFSVRYRQSFLGPAWAFIQPAILLAFYGLLFVRALGVTSDRGPYILFAWCGLTSWVFFSSSLLTAVPSLVQAQGLITKVYFPREVIPLAAALVSGVDLTIATAVLVVLAAVTAGLHLSMLALIPLYLCLMLFTGAATVLAATLAAFARDMVHALPLALQVAFIATPVMYPRSIVPPRFAWAYEINPIALIIEQIRVCVIDGRWPSAKFLGIGLLAGATALYLAVAYVRSVEHRLPDVG